MAAQQEFARIQLQLTSAEEQIGTLSTAIDAVRAEAGNAIRELRDQMAAEQVRHNVLMQAVSRNGGTGRDWALISSKDFQGGIFSGAKTDNFRVWAKKVKVFLNTKKEGFKKILETIEKDEDAPVDQRLLSDLNLNWEHGVLANGRLSDFLQTYCHEDALRLVESCPENGFEAWRLLKKRYDPSTGNFELTKMNRMISRKACKDLSDLPAAIDILEKDIRGYESSMNVPFPAEWKIPLLLQLIPENYKHELEAKYAMGDRDFRRMCENIGRYANERRLAEGRGRRDMEVDTLDATKPPDQMKDEDWELDWLGKGGKKNKGKGKGGKDGNNGGKNNKGKGKGEKETRECWWCLKAGHL